MSLPGFTTEWPWLATSVLFLGTFSLIKLVIKTFSVLTQTFILPGTNVRHIPSSVSFSLKNVLDIVNEIRRQKWLMGWWVMLTLPRLLI
jgi:hypothetical protein